LRSNRAGSVEKVLKISLIVAAAFIMIAAASFIPKISGFQTLQTLL